MCVISHQAKHDEEDLDDVGVGHGDEPTQEGVAEGDHGGHDDGDLLVDVEDDLERGAESAEDGGRPEDLGHGGGQGLEGAPLAVLLCEGVDHGHVLRVSHNLREECST